MKRFADRYLPLSMFGMGLVAAAGLQTPQGRDRAFIVGLAIVMLLPVIFVVDAIRRRKSEHP